MRWASTPRCRIGGHGPTPWLYDDRLRMGGVKLYADGALGSRGAWLKAPYADAPGQRGCGFMTDDQLRNLMSRAAMDGFQVAVHAIGDARQRAGARRDRGAVATPIRATGAGGSSMPRSSIPADLPRFGKHGIIASMQPTHADLATGRWPRRGSGPTRLAGAYAWRSMLTNGAPLAFGSDYPVESPNPFAGWAAAFTRQDADGAAVRRLAARRRRVTREQAWRGLHRAAPPMPGSPRTSSARSRPGQRADFIIVDRDPLLASAADLRAHQGAGDLGRRREGVGDGNSRRRRRRSPTTAVDDERFGTRCAITPAGTHVRAASPRYDPGTVGIATIEVGRDLRSGRATQARQRSRSSRHASSFARDARWAMIGDRSCAVRWRRRAVVAARQFDRAAEAGSQRRSAQSVRQAGAIACRRAVQLGRCEPREARSA